MAQFRSAKGLRLTIRSPADQRVMRLHLALRPRHLAAADAHAPLSEKVMSLVGELKFRWIVTGRLDEPLRDELVKNSSLVRLQICAGARE